MKRHVFNMIKIKDKTFIFEGKITLKEILMEIKRECKYCGEYEKDRNRMIRIITKYLEMLQ